VKVDAKKYVHNFALIIKVLHGGALNVIFVTYMHQTIH
jgi:hypothetical protein